MADLDKYFGKVYQGLRRVSGSDRILRDFGNLRQFLLAGLGGKGAYGSTEVEPMDKGEDGAGYEADPKVRKAVEERAVTLAKEIYALRGYSVEEVGKPFDLRCRREIEEIHVEVKGTRSKGESVILTAGEVSHAHNPPCRTDLVLVTGIKIFDKPDGTIIGIDGHIAYHIESWRPAEDDLTPTEYRYAVPMKECN